MCFVWIWEQTAIISLYSIDWLVFITATECVYCVVRSTFCPHTVFMFLCGSENKQRLFHCTALTDWLVFITATECVYCVVRSTFYVLPTHGIYVFVWIWEQTAIISLYSINWLVGFYNWDGVCLLRGTFYILRSAHTRYLCILCGSENKQRLLTSPHQKIWWLRARCSLTGTFTNTPGPPLMVRHTTILTTYW